MENEQLLVWYNVGRVAVLVIAMYGIIYFLWFTKRGKKAEEPARKMLEDDDES